MASSSLSQEDVDHDFEMSSRRSRIRSARANARNTPTCRLADGDAESTGMIGGVSVVTGPLSGASTGLPGTIGTAGASSNAPGASEAASGMAGGTGAAGDHDVSPKPSSRAKDKRCPRPNHVNKGKAQRERRKLREKRRSTGVVHLPSTESTGGSTGEDEDELLSMSTETKRNTAYNEAQAEKATAAVAEGETLPMKCYPIRNNKSPSDLDADDEDNQDYDSAVNQSDSAVSLLHETGTIEVAATRPTVNGRPETPCSENLEELLDRAREENCRLLELLKERDDRISVLEQTVNNLSRDLAVVDTTRKKLQEENQTLIKAMAETQIN